MQLFRPGINLIVNLSLLAIVLILAGSAGLVYLLVRSPYLTEVGLPKAQPVPFSHKQHVGGLGLDCRYCHASVEESNFAGIPTTETCMGCHTQIAPEASTLAPVRESFQNDQALEWNRVNSVPGFVYFDHSIHIQKGVGCETCHGRVDQMALVSKAETLQMDWCLACHRAPEQFLRPVEEVFTMGWTAPADQVALGRQLIAEHDIQLEHLTDCSTCHR